MILKFKVGQEIICTKEEDNNKEVINNPGIILEINPAGRLPYLVGFTKAFTGSHSDGPARYKGKCWWCSGESFQLYKPSTPQEKVKNKINYLWNKQNYTKTLKHV